METRRLTFCFYNKMSAAVHFMQKKKKFLLTQKLRDRKKSKRLSQSSSPREPLVVQLNEKSETEAERLEELPRSLCAPNLTNPVLQRNSLRESIKPS